MGKPPVNQVMFKVCNVFSHQWSEWILNEKSCATTRRCRRCKAEETQDVEHEWGEWKFFLHKCVQVRVCAHCDHRETRDADHDWGEWQNTKQYNCGNGKKVRECKRCNEIQTSPNDLVHTWEEWQVNREKCRKQRVCPTCGEKEYAPEHDWGDWSVYDGKCGNVRVCQTCGNSERTFRHMWGPWKIKDPICVELRECQNCGALDFSTKRNPGKGIEHAYKMVRSWIDTSRTEQYRHPDSGKRYQIELWKCKRCGEEQKRERYDYIVIPDD